MSREVLQSLLRLALYRLRLSIKEYLGELPSEMEQLFAETVNPASDAPARLFAPTRPTLLSKGDKVRVMVVVTGDAPVCSVSLNVRLRGAAQWTSAPARLLGRRTYQAILGPFDGSAELAEYYFSADVGDQALVATADASRGAYFVTLA